MSERVWLGLDVGSVSLKTTLLDSSGAVVFEDYRRTNGRVFETLLEALEICERQFGPETVEAAAITGSGGEQLAQILGGRFVNEIVAQSVGLGLAAPQARTAIEIGGQDAKFLTFEGGELDKRVLRDFAMNSLCAAGTGSFLDQQATRLGVAIEEEFGAMALRSDSPPRIAGRCSVFAKSDMIHLQQIATPVHDIVAGLCLALARSFKSTVGKGKAFEPPIAFVGGVASNAGMVWAFEDVLGIESGSLVVPERHQLLGAIGAAQLALNEGIKTEYAGAEAVRAHLVQKAAREGKNLPQLRSFLTPAGTPSNEPVSPEPKEGEKVPAYLGIDVGSISTNVVALDESNRVLAKRYLPTASRPIEAVQKGIAEIGDEIGDRIEVLGVATTGSGRYLTGELVGADVIRNEITAQATAAILIDPEVDTIFEIGGQDSKYISIEHGTVCDFEMNRACAAGTGSFLEEQAERLDIDLKTEFSPMALDAEAPVSLGDRCTVFMESDLIHHQQCSAPTPDLLAGLGYSIAHNYLNRVVGDRRVGDKIFFQGGTAFNKAVVAAFNQITGKEVIVPPHHEVTGAIGAAMLARRFVEEAAGSNGDAYKTKFRGFDFSKMHFKIESFVCKECENLCEIRMVRLEGQKPVYYGSRCEKYDVDRHSAAIDEIPDLFAEREALLLDGMDPNAPAPEKLPSSKGVIGIPLSLSFHEMLPYWRAFFESLGFQVVLSGRTTKKVVREGVETVAFETCFPVKIAHGHLFSLLEKKPDLLFLPSLINTKNEDFDEKDSVVFNCPFIQTIPYTASCAIDFEAYGARVFSPILHLQHGEAQVEKDLAKHADTLQASRRDIHEAMQKATAAQEAFRDALERRGAEVLATLSVERPGLVVVSRPYNGCDPGMNLDLPKKLRALGVTPIPLDMLGLRDVPLAKRWRKVYWPYGQRIMKTAQLIKQSPSLFGVYVTNFSCGPDSFVLDYFHREMAGKPFLQLEIDEHSADAGLITRCEAFLDTLGGLAEQKTKRETVAESAPVAPVEKREYTNHRKLYIPFMSPHSYGLAAAFRSAGMDATVMDASDEDTLTFGQRHTSGRECYPCLLTTGDMVRQTQRPGFDRDRSAFFMASANGPCRFGQYNNLQRHVLDKLGFDDIPVFTLDQDSDFREDTKDLGAVFERNAWQGFVTVDVLEKLLFETRPYELEKGASEAWFWESVHAASEAVSNGASKHLWKVLPKLAENHARIQCDKSKKRVLIGVVGEVYVRTNDFANNFVVKSLEALGAEAVVPTMGEWFRYINLMRAEQNRTRGRRWQLLKDIASDKFITHDEKKIYAAFGRVPDPPPEELFKLAQPYLDPSFQGEAILTIGKSIEMLEDLGAGGIVNTMPFTCMPGTICSALFKRVREDFDEFPVFNVAYTGQQELNNQVRLEAFVYQARQFIEKRAARS